MVSKEGGAMRQSSRIQRVSMTTLRAATPQTGWERGQTISPPKAFQVPDDLGLDGRFVTPVGVWCTTLSTARIGHGSSTLEYTRSSGWTAMLRYAVLTSNFAIKVPGPCLITKENSGLKPSFMLDQIHLLCCAFLVIIPKLLIWRLGKGIKGKGGGPATPWRTVLLILGFWKAEGLFFLAALSESLSWLKAKTETMPSRTLIPACWSGCPTQIVPGSVETPPTQGERQDTLGMARL